MDVGSLVVAVGLTGYILWQIVTGRIPLEDSRKAILRLTEPLKYWLIILGECAIVAVIVVLGGMD